MPVVRPRLLLAGLAVLASVWLWPLPGLGLPPFSTHMLMHMGVVAVAAPLVALGVAGGSLDPVEHFPRACSAVAASIVELVAVWAWHTPQLHHAARSQVPALLLEQTTFLAAGLFLWLCALGGSPAVRRRRSMSGTAGLLLTSMHMTLLGALIALSSRLLYAPCGSSTVLTPLMDQQLGGAIMLFVGALVYLIGGLGLVGETLLFTSAKRVKP